LESHNVTLLRTDGGSEYCANLERHEYEHYLAIEDIDYSRKKPRARRPMAFCERFHRRASGRSRWLGPRIQPGAPPALVLRQNTDADLPCSNADDEGEDDRSVTASDSKTRSLLSAMRLQSVVFERALAVLSLA